MKSISGVSTQQPLQLKNNNSNDAYDRQIKNLNEMKSKLEDQKSKLGQDRNIDERIRKERPKVLAEQTQAIDAQISQLKIDKMKDKQEEKSGQKEKTNDASQSSDSKTMEQIAQDHLTVNSIQNMRQTKTKMENEAKNLKSDIRIDTLRIELGPGEDKDKAALLENAEETVFKPKREEISELNGKVGKINKKIGELYTRMRKTENTDHQASGASEDQKSQAVEQGERRDEEQVRSSDSAVKSIDIKA